MSGGDWDDKPISQTLTELRERNACVPGRFVTLNRYRSSFTFKVPVEIVFILFFILFARRLNFVNFYTPPTGICDINKIYEFCRLFTKKEKEKKSFSTVRHRFSPLST